MKLIISGSKGFVGKNLSGFLLQTGYVLNTISRVSEKDNEISWTHVTANNKIIRSADVFIHLAGKAHDLNDTIDAEEYFAVNTGLTKLLFDTFLESPSRDFIYFSSVKAVADTVDGVLNEDVAPNPQTPYGQSKQQAEEYLLAQPLPGGKRLFIIRPCMIHGPGNKGNLNLLFKFVQKRIPYPLAAFNNQRSFLSISNLNFVIEKIISEPAIPGGIYNLADDEPLSTNEVINIIAQTIGLKPKLWKLNPAFIKGIASIGDKLHLPLTTERLKKLTENYIVSNQKIKTVLHLDHLPVSSKEGLIITIKSFSAH